jgi:hypothetical protein
MNVKRGPSQLRHLGFGRSRIGNRAIELMIGRGRDAEGVQIREPVLGSAARGNRFHDEHTMSSSTPGHLPCFSIPFDPEHWLRRANEMRALAARVRDPDAKAALLRVAEDYEQLAIRAEEGPMLRA